MSQIGSLEAAHDALVYNLASLSSPVVSEHRDSLTRDDHLQVISSMVVSRAMDLAARRLKPTGRVFYTIGSAGHEGNALVAHHLRLTDPALLHYRSGAFCAHRVSLSKSDPVEFLFPSFLSSVKDPVSGGRHKVLGAPGVIPQTSTIASHAPRAVGMALALPRSVRLSLGQDVFPQDSIVVCSFGDASFNHSTLQGAINAASVASFQKIPLPLVFLCENNGIGISTRSPSGFIKSRMGNHPGIDYLELPPGDLLSWHDLLRESLDKVRLLRKPLFIHMPTVRLGGHAGTDAESAYRTPEEIRLDYGFDPILCYARNLTSSGVFDADHLKNHITGLFEATSRYCDDIVKDPSHVTLQSRASVVKALAPRSPDALATHSERLSKTSVAGPDKALTLAQSINHTLSVTLETLPQATVFGQDVGAKGGVYGVTKGLQRRFGRSRVFDSILDEQSILGYALGSSLLGALPIPEIQYLAYLHNAEDQLRGEASSLSFFSAQQYRNGLVLRIASYGYQRGFGGHFHNDNSVSVLRDIPGLVIASPSRPKDAASMLSSCIAHAAHDGTVCVFLEPIALYHTTDLFEPGDGLFAEHYPSLDALEPLGSPRFYPAPDGSSGSIVLASWANGLYMSLRTQRALQSHGIKSSVVDLRFLAPLPIDELSAFAKNTPILVVDETRFSGGPGEAVVSSLAQLGHDSVKRVSSADSFVPTGPASNLVLLQESEILKSALDMLNRR